MQIVVSCGSIHMSLWCIWELHHQTVMQLVMMLSLVQRQKFTRMSEEMWFFLRVLRQKRCSWKFLTRLEQPVVQVLSTEMWAPRNLKLFTRSTTVPMMWMGVCVSAILLKSTMSSLFISLLGSRLSVCHHSDGFPLCLWWGRSPWCHLQT